MALLHDPMHEGKLQTGRTVRTELTQSQDQPAVRPTPCWIPGQSQGCFFAFPPGLGRFHLGGEGPHLITQRMNPELQGPWGWLGGLLRLAEGDSPCPVPPSPGGGPSVVMIMSCMPGNSRKGGLRLDLQLLSARVSAKASFFPPQSST